MYIGCWWNDTKTNQPANVIESKQCQVWWTKNQSDGFNKINNDQMKPIGRVYTVQFDYILNQYWFVVLKISLKVCWLSWCWQDVD